MGPKLKLHFSRQKLQKVTIAALIRRQVRTVSCSSTTKWQLNAAHANCILLQHLSDYFRPWVMDLMLLGTDLQPVSFCKSVENSKNAFCRGGKP